MRNRSVLVMLLFSILLGLSPLAADTVIRRGVDIFTTPADGRTYYDFAKTPIPAGFFCKGSKAFTGRVALKGLPLTTRTPGQLWNADTVVERLDDAAFDAQGVAVTRLQLRALSLVSIAPIKTSCGAFHAYVSLDGRQRITTMRIFRSEEGGGTFEAPLAVDARLTFIPVKSVKSVKNKSARKLELIGSFNFPVSSHPWSLGEESKIKKLGAMVVDTDGDLTPDFMLPATSNFQAGVPPEHVGAYSSGCTCCPPVYECHSGAGHQHCYEIPACSEIPSCC